METTAEFLQRMDGVLKETLKGVPRKQLIQENKERLKKLETITGTYDKEKDVDNSEISEGFFCNYLTLKGFEIIKCNTKQKTKDSHVLDVIARKSEKDYSFELKTDFKFKTTGNIGLEYAKETENGVLDSGIFTSNADYVVYLIPHANCLVFFKRELLIKYMQGRIQTEEKPWVPGGDDKKFRIMLFKINKHKGNNVDPVEVELDIKYVDQRVPKTRIEYL